MHGYDTQQSLAFAVDGATVTPTDGQTVEGDEIVVTRTSHLLHAETAATVHAITNVTYTLNRHGLTVETAMTWQTATRVDNGYTAMFPLSAAVFDAGQLVNSAELDLSVSDGQHVGKVRSPLAAVWDSGGEWGAFMYVPDPAQATNGWVTSTPIFLSIERRDANTRKGVPGPRRAGVQPRNGRQRDRVAVEGALRREAVQRRRRSAGRHHLTRCIKRAMARP